MRVELVIPAEPGIPYFVQPPIGLLYAASALAAAGHEVTLRDKRIANGGPPEPAELHILATTDYDSAQCYPTDLSAVALEVENLRRNSSAPIVLVGAHGTVAPEATLQATRADCVLRGEHEVVIPDCVSARAWNEKVWPVAPRVASSVEVATQLTPAYELAPMHLYFSEGVDPQTGQLQRVNTGLVLANRGCPYRCSFCHLFFGQKLRHRPLPLVIEELKIQRRRFGIRHFFFLDYTFTLQAEWVRQLCDLIIDSDLDIFWTCQTRCELLREDLLPLMRRAGCTAIWLGVESPDHVKRAAIRKDLSQIEIEQALTLLRRHQIEPLVFAMVGFPDETQGSLRALNDWLNVTGVYYALSILLPRVGAPLFDELVDEATLARRGWKYFDDYGDYLGISKLPRSELNWFVDFHDQNERRVTNAIRQNSHASS
jgi:anaerobic magnesium-protoporphyrin IX monomethyl ester cyclase